MPLFNFRPNIFPRFRQRKRTLPETSEASLSDQAPRPALYIRLYKWLAETEWRRRWPFYLLTKKNIFLAGLAGFTGLFFGALAGLFGGIFALLIILGFIFIGVSVYDYKTGVLISVVLLPLTATVLIPREILGITGLNPMNVVLVLSVFSLLFSQAFARRRMSLPSVPRAFILYGAAIIFAGMLGASNAGKIPTYFEAEKVVRFTSAVGYVRDILLKPMIIIACALLLAIAVANARRVILYLLPFFFSAIILPLVVIIYVALSGVSLSVLAGSHARGFLTVLGIHANELGLMFNMAFAMAAFCFFAITRPWLKILMGCVCAILVVGIALTFSRGAFLGFLVTLAYFLFMQRKIRMMITVIAVIAVGSLLVPSAVVERASMGIASGKANNISAGRIDGIWLPVLPEVLTSPLVGHGLSSILWSEAARYRRILPVGHPHSAYIGVLLDLGILGVAIFTYFFYHMWAYFRYLLQHHPDPIWRAFFTGARATILLMLVQGITDDRFTPTLPQIYMWLAYGLAIGVTSNLQRQQQLAGQARTSDKNLPATGPSAARPGRAATMRTS